MAINMNLARKLCTKPELELVQESSPKNIGELSERDLRTRVRRARTLRDKYQTLASRQQRIVRGKQERRGVRASEGNENTLRKQEIFDQVLTRFEDKLSKLEAKSESQGTPRGKAPAGSRRRPSLDRGAAKAALSGRKKRKSSLSESEDAWEGKARSGRKGRKKEPRAAAARGSGGGATKKAGGETRAAAPEAAGAPAASRGRKKARSGKKKTARKTTKKRAAGGARGASGIASLLGGAPLPGVSGLAGPGGVSALGLPAGFDGEAARNTSLRTRSNASKGKRVQRRQDAANRPAIRGHVSARGRRSQARRDSR
jgi:hypothetical protein